MLPSRICRKALTRVRRSPSRPVVSAVGSAVAAFAMLLLLASSNACAQQPLPAEGDEARLLEVLKSDAELFDKSKACQRLAVIGTSESVPVLAELLADENLAHYARFGLESNPAPEVDDAFREALAELEGESLIGVINSIGVRRDSGAVDVLVAASGDTHEDVAAAAMAALGAIASTESIVAIQKALDDKESLQVAAADACLTAADVLLTEGKNTEAASIFAALRAADLPKHINVASRFGEIRAGSGDASELLTRYLAEEDNDLFRIGLELAHELTGKETTQSLLKQLESLPTGRRVLLISVLGSRGDPSALPAMLAAVDSDNAEVKFAATNVLGRLGDVSVVTILLETAVAGDDRLEQAASDSLAELAGADVDAALTEALTDSNGRERVVLVEAVGRRGISEAIPTLLKFMASDEPELRNASIDALGMTVGANELPKMVDRLMGATRSGPIEDSPIKDALRKACQRMPDRDAAASVLLDRMGGASAVAKAELLDLLIYVGGTKALDGIGAAAKSGDDALADAATQALGKWLTPDVAPVLLDLAQNGNEKYRVRCLRGYIRVIRQFGLRQGQRLQMSKTAFKTATRDEERKLVLDTLTRFPSAASLKVIMPHLSDPALQDEAGKAAVTICEKIVNTDRKTVAAAMPKVLAAINDPELASRAKVVISRANAK